MVLLKKYIHIKMINYARCSFHNKRKVLAVLYTILSSNFSCEFQTAKLEIWLD